MRHAVTAILVAQLVWWAPVAAAQEPAPAPAPELTAEQQFILELNNEVERLANDLQSALEQNVALQMRFNLLTQAYNGRSLSDLRRRSLLDVPEGFVFDWTIAPTGQRRGLVPISEPEELEEPG